MKRAYKLVNRNRYQCVSTNEPNCTKWKTFHHIDAQGDHTFDSIHHGDHLFLRADEIASKPD